MGQPNYLEIKRACAYIRYSSDNQRDESLEAQIRAIKEFGYSKGYEIVKVYQDKAKSATTDRRPGFQQMIKDSGNDIFDIVIVHKLDRFSRDKYDSAQYKRKLKQNGVKLISVTENLDDSPESVILESVIEGMAEYYSKNLAREIMKGMKETAYQAKHTGGLPPLGYDVNAEKKYVINEREAESVRLIFEMYTARYTLSQMVDELNSRGFKTKAGAMFKSNSINSVLTNEKYTGVYIFNKSAKKDAYGRRNSHLQKDPSEIIRIEDGMPQIVGKELYEKAQEILRSRKKSKAVNKAKESYLLSGLIRCGECGYAMYGNRRQAKNKPLYVSYRCGCRMRTSSKVCSNKEIRKEYIEEYVLTELEARIFNDKAIPMLVEGINENLKKQSQGVEDKKSVIEKELKDIEKQIGNIVMAITNGFIQEEFKVKMEELKERKVYLEGKLVDIDASQSVTKVTEEDIRGLLTGFKEYVVTKNIPECKNFIQDFVKEVIVYKTHVEVVFNVGFNVPEKISLLEIAIEIDRKNVYYTKKIWEL